MKTGYENEDTPLNQYQIDAVRDIIYAHRIELKSRLDKIIEDSLIAMRDDIVDKLRNLTKYG